MEETLGFFILTKLLMAEKRFNDYYRLLEEWKEVVKLANTDLTIRENANLKINSIIAELKKPFKQRSADVVFKLLRELEKVNGIERYVRSSMDTIIEVCKSE